MKRILINSSYGNELRVALVDGAKLYDLDTELSDKTLLKGSIFKATVSRNYCSSYKRRKRNKRCSTYNANCSSW